MTTVHATATDVMSEWSVTCSCKKLTLAGHGRPIFVATCHCADCRRVPGPAVPSHALLTRAPLRPHGPRRKANGGKPSEDLLLCKSSQVTLPTDASAFIIKPATEWEDKVPRYFCAACDTLVLADCTPIGLNLAFMPIGLITPEVNAQPAFHMHLRQRVSEPPDDGLPKYHALEDPHMKVLMTAIADRPQTQDECVRIPHAVVALPLELSAHQESLNIYICSIVVWCTT